MKSWKKPTPEQIARAVAALGRPGHHSHFFDRLENPEWVSPLLQAGFFKEPPSLVRDDAAHTYRFPLWPESRYLVRMAELAPQAVFEATQAIPVTDNISVWEDLADIALAIPPEQAAIFVAQAEGWLKTPFQ